MTKEVRSAHAHSIAWAALVTVGLCVSSALGAVNTSGDTTLGPIFAPTYVGRNANGTLDIDGGSSLNSGQSYVGYNAGATGTATIGGSGSTWTPSTLRVGYFGTGTLNVQAGGNVTNSTGEIGALAGSTGAATVTGTGSTWTSNTRLVVGRDGSGALTVADGGLVTARTLYASLADLFGNGTISAHGAILDSDLVFDATHGSTQALIFGSGGSLNLNINGQGELGVGHQGAANLRIADGATVASGDGYLGAWRGSDGTATITGAGSRWRTGPSLPTSDLYAGSYGTGTLRIEAGGEVSNRYAYLAHQAGSTGTTMVNGANSKWTIDRQFYIGHGGAGALNIGAGGRVTSAGGYLGYNPGSNGSVTVSGAGSTWDNSFELHVGYGGRGSLTVADGGSVIAESFFGSLDDVHGNGSISAEGAVLDANLTFNQTHGTTQALGFGSGGALNLKLERTAPLGAGYKSSGTLLITDGVTVPSFGGYLGYHAGSTGTATVRGSASTWDSSTLRVGHSGSGLLNIEAGALVQSNSDGYLAYNVGSTGTAVVSGAGSRWENNSGLYVGFRGAGTLLVTDGAEVIGSPGYIGFHVSSTGLATVRGNGSVWTSSTEIDVGVFGNGALIVEAGGEVIPATSAATLRPPARSWSREKVPSWQPTTGSTSATPAAARSASPTGGRSLQDV